MILKLRTLTNFLIPALRKHEAFILDAVKKQLDKEASLLLSKQIDQINYVRRFWEDKEVNLYCKKINRKKIENLFKFPLDKNEAKLATVHFKISGDSQKIKADIWLVDGFIFQIQFAKSPKKIKENSMEIIKVEIHQNPMEKSKEFKSELGDSSQFQGWMKEWAEKYKILNVKKPLAKRDIDILIKERQTGFPKDYLEIISQCEGVQINNWKILGISEVYSINLKEKEYLVMGICENDADYFFVKAGSQDGLVYFQKHDDDEPENLGNSLKTAILKKIDKSQ